MDYVCSTCVMAALCLGMPCGQMYSKDMMAEYGQDHTETEGGLQLSKAQIVVEKQPKSKLL